MGSREVRVLFGWEFGAGLGHVTRFRPVAERLIAEGWDVVCALQDVERGDALIDKVTGRRLARTRVIQAPRWNISNDPKLRQVPTHSFADVMRLIGYGNSEALRYRISAWRDLIEVVRPDVVVGDFSPTLNLAARGRVPRIGVGNGYTTPPAGRPMPPIRPWQESLEDFSVNNERILLDAVNEALRAVGDPEIEFLVDVLHGDETFVFTLPLVDPYARYRSEPTLSPFNMPRDITPRPVNERIRNGLFLYLPRGHKLTGPAMRALGAANLQGQAYISDLPADVAVKQSKPGLVVHPEPQDFAKVLPSVRLVVHHGGLSTAVAALLAGTPQFILPWNLEHAVTARCLSETGGTHVLDPNREDETSLRNAMSYLVNDLALASRALRAAGKVDQGDPEAGVAKMVARVKALAGG
jgi:UDP-N-acetylglucosamine:LPS N-acetylglucosamine transferase